MVELLRELDPHADPQSELEHGLDEAESEIDTWLSDREDAAAEESVRQREDEDEDWEEDDEYNARAFSIAAVFSDL